MENFDVKYEEIGKNYRFFLTWRYGIFAAHLVVIWSAFSIAYKSIESKIDPGIAGLILFIAAIVSLCLWIAEIRNRELYRGLIQKGKILEDSENQAYSILSNLSKINRRFRLITQSASLDILAYICFITLFDSAIFLMNKPDLQHFNMGQISCTSKYIVFFIDILFFVLIDPFGIKYIYLNSRKQKATK